MMRRVMVASSQDPIFTSLEGTIESQLKAYDPDIATAGDYNNGIKAKRSRKFKDAAQHFFAVMKDYPRYELAIGHVRHVIVRRRFDVAPNKPYDLGRIVLQLREKK